jgi:hypothetical protein
LKIRALGENIICINADFGDQVTQSGLVIKSNIDQSQGITSRWFEVFEVGPDITWLTPGEWVLVEYGRWTPHFELEDDRLPGGKTKAWKVDPKGCLATAEQKPETFYYNSDVVTADKLVR